MVWSIVALEAVSFTALLTLGAIRAGADIGLIVSLVKQGGIHMAFFENTRKPTRLRRPASWSP